METMAFATSTSKVPYHSLLSSPVRAVTSTRSSISFALKQQKNKQLPFRTTLLRSQTRPPLSKLRIIRCGAITEIKETEFTDVVSESSIPVLVEFVATWCGPCRLIKPAMESIAQEYKEKLVVVKVDHDSNPKLIEEYKVYGLPTLILFKDGKEVPESRREGAITKVKLKAYIDGLLETVSVA